MTKSLNTLARSFLHHVQKGTLISTVRRRLPRILRAPPPLNRFNARSPRDAAAVLVTLVAPMCRKPKDRVLVVNCSADFAAVLTQDLTRAGMSWSSVEPSALPELSATDVSDVACIVLGGIDSQRHFQAALMLVKNPHTAELPLEYIALPRLENAPVQGWDLYENGDFVSPLLAKSGQSYFEVYRQSLERFRQKTDIRDYLDLSQLLQSAISRGLAGNVAEFGSFRGHSGYLTSRVLEFLGSDKLLFMFDMFENFPQEDVGVDRFWSGTHQVNFEEVKAKFHDRPNVRLVKGDFTKTLAQTDTGQICLAFIDCDSYRATKYLLDYLWDSRLVPGSIVVMEDYGHAALLGNRLAVHEFFDGRKDAFTYFSHFSGFFVAVKLPSWA